MTELSSEEKELLNNALRQLVQQNDICFSRRQGALGEIYVTDRGAAALNYLNIGIEIVPIKNQGLKVRRAFDFFTELDDPLNTDTRYRAPYNLVVTKLGELLGERALGGKTGSDEIGYSIKALEGAKHIALTNEGREHDGVYGYYHADRPFQVGR